jgi:uncharacterized protein YqeY
MKKPERLLCKTSYKIGHSLKITEGKFYEVVYNPNDTEETISIKDDFGQISLHYIYSDDQDDNHGLPRTYAKWFYTKKELAKKRLNNMSTFKQKIESRIVEALRASNSELLTVLRDIKTQIVNEEKNNKNQEIDEAQTMKIVEKMAKSRKQSIDLFIQGNRPDLADKEKYELSVIESYLPKKLSSDEVASIIQEIISANKYTAKRETGLVIKKFNETYAGMSDGGTISKICGEYLK